MPAEPEFEQPSERSIWLWPDGAEPTSLDDGFRAWLDPHLIETDPPRGAVLVLPGGGYTCRVPHESAVIARRFNEAGFHAFVVHYHVMPHRHPAALHDVWRAIRMVRQQFGPWRIVPDRVALCGFSAGGHLTAHAACCWAEGDVDAADPLDRYSSRPDAQIPCYGVLGDYNRQCYLNLLGDDATDADAEAVRPDLLVTDRTPPAFLWMTADDEMVPLANSLDYAAALNAHEVPVEMHIYPHGLHGLHGLGLAPDDPHVATWSDLCVEWLEGMGWGG